VEAIRGDELACLVAKVEPVGPKSFHMDLHMLENRFEFQRALRPDPQGASS
jgi:sulfopyruvate decarboxylase subunit beta